MKLINRNYLVVFLCISITSISCKQNNSSATNGELIRVGYKTLQLDNETSYNRVSPKIKIIDNTEYITFHNSNNRSLYIYNYQTNELINKIVLASEGPNEIKGRYIKGYYIHSLTTIFINTNQYLYQINDKGDIIYKLELPKGQDTFRFYNRLTVDFNDATYFKNNVLHTNIIFPIHGKNTANPIRATINFKTGEINNKHIDIRTLYKNYDELLEFETYLGENGLHIGIDNQAVYAHDKLYITTTINDSILMFSKNELKEKYFAGHLDFPVPDVKTYLDTYDVSINGKSRSLSEKPDSGPYFVDLTIDLNKENIYRILFHGREEIIEENPEVIETDANPLFANFPKFRKRRITGASLIQFNIKSKSNRIYKLPIDDVNPNSMIIGKSGLHFQLKEQNSEDEITFVVYKLE